MRRYIDDVDIQKTRGIHHQLAQQLAPVVNIQRLVFRLVNQVQFFVAPRQLVGHEVQFVFLAGEREALLIVGQQQLAQQDKRVFPRDRGSRCIRRRVEA